MYVKKFRLREVVYPGEKPIYYVENSCRFLFWEYWSEVYVYKRTNLRWRGVFYNNLLSAQAHMSEFMDDWARHQNRHLVSSTVLEEREV